MDAASYLDVVRKAAVSALISENKFSSEEAYKLFDASTLPDKVRAGVTGLELLPPNILVSMMVPDRGIANLDPHSPEVRTGLSKIIREEIAKTHAAGISTAHSDEYGLYLRTPGGQKRYYRLLDKGASNVSSLTTDLMPDLRAEYSLESLAIDANSSSKHSSRLELSVSFCKPPTLKQVSRLKKHLSDTLQINIRLVLRSQ